MPGQAHEIITAYAVALLPDDLRRRLGDAAELLVRECCHYPDWYCGIGTPQQKAAAPYYYATDGIQFHYLPDTPIVPAYRYWRVSVDGARLELPERPPNLNWLHAARGFRYYLERGADAMRAGELGAAAGYLGCLLHMLQDATFGLHSLEGPEGTDLFVLDRLFPEPRTGVNELPSMAGLEFPDPGPAILRDMPPPRVLGLYPEEAVFHLYTRYCNGADRARRLLFQMLLNRRTPAAQDAQECVAEMYRGVISCCADVLLTVHALAGAAAPVETGHLAQVVLSDMAPVERPWGLSHYRFMTMQRDRVLDDRGMFAPLRLAFVCGNHREIRAYARGLGLGTHYEAHLAYEVPRGIYAKFACALGLDAQCAERGSCRVQVLQDGQPVQEFVLDAGCPAVEFAINRPGGRLELDMRQSGGIRAADTRLVWAEPRLFRAGA